MLYKSAKNEKSLTPDENMSKTLKFLRFTLMKNYRSSWNKRKSASGFREFLMRSLIR